MRKSLILAATLLAATPTFAQVNCGGSFSSFLANIKAESISRGHSGATVNRFPRKCAP